MGCLSFVSHDLLSKWTWLHTWRDNFLEEFVSYTLLWLAFLLLKTRSLRIPCGLGAVRHSRCLRWLNCIEAVMVVARFHSFHLLRFLHNTHTVLITGLALRVEEDKGGELKVWQRGRRKLLINSAAYLSFHRLPEQQLLLVLHRKRRALYQLGRLSDLVRRARLQCDDFPSRFTQ